METALDKGVPAEREPVQELEEIAHTSQEALYDVLPPHLQTLVDVRPEMRAAFNGFTTGNTEREQRKFLGLLVEHFCSYDLETRERRVTDEEFDAILRISVMPGFSFVHQLISDIRKSDKARALGEEKPPIEQRVIREIPIKPPASMADTSFHCGLAEMPE